jgi:hypothetical protein
MSKIPQGEWSAIAARYAKGESITRIAQSYGCTPPAIHYILKRNRHRAGQNPGRMVNGKPDPAMTIRGEPGGPTISEGPSTPEPRGGDRGVGRLAPGEVRPIAGQPLEPRPAGEAVTPIPERRQPALPQRAMCEGSALTAGLDRELHGRAEAAIAAFRSSFDAALAEGSPVVRQRLRQAASDLMRVAARTTIVLDRLNASAERESARAPDQLRWSQGR